MATNLEKILQEVQALSLEDQRRLRQRLDEALPAAPTIEQASEEAFRQHVIDAGLLRRAPWRRTQPMPVQRRQRVHVQGKPLSETVIEGRR